MRTVQRFVSVQPVESEADVIHHPSWRHSHVLWVPIYLPPQNCGLSPDEQGQIMTTLAMAACQGTGAERASVYWERRWVMSFPVEDAE